MKGKSPVVRAFSDKKKVISEFFYEKIHKYN